MSAGKCRRRIRYVWLVYRIRLFGRSVGIRTRGLLDPNQARYQASPHPVNSGIIMNYFPIVKWQPPLFPAVCIFIAPHSYTSLRWFT